VEEKKMKRKRKKLKKIIGLHMQVCGYGMAQNIYSFSLGRELRKIKFGHVLAQIR
jgi:carbamoylphosphate synthase small subunit